jgi:hypothetical protein
MALKLFIIQPSHYRSRSNLTLLKVKKRTLVGLTLRYLAALTPRDWEVTLIDEQLSEIDFGSGCALRLDHQLLPGL